MAILKSELVRLADAGITATPNLIGLWLNGLKSEMNIKSQTGNDFAGDYKSKDAANNWVTGTLQGTAAGDTVGFIVNWEPTYASVTAWAGKILADPNTKTTCIYTLWDLARGDAATPIWLSICAGSDTFSPPP